MKSTFKKEIVITILIVGLVVIGNIATQNYTKKCVEVLNKNIEDLKQYLINKEEEEENYEAEEIMKEINNNWSDMYKKMAYYIEHDELEKVKTEIVAINGNIEVKDYKQAISGIEKCKFILEHIRDKTALTIQNIF